MFRSKTLSTVFAAFLALTVFLTGGCGPTEPSVVDPGPDGTTSACQPNGSTRCSGSSYQICQNGAWAEAEQCNYPQVCDPGLGCVDCSPGSRVCVGDNVHECTAQGTVGSQVGNCPPGQCANGACTGQTDCVGGTDLIYLVDDGDTLYSFNPRNDQHILSPLGTISCPAGSPWPAVTDPFNPAATPFSMSVERNGRAWVLYTSGEIFWVDIDTLQCQASTFQKGASGFELFGMGFVSDSPNSSAETLFVAGGSAANMMTSPARLGTIDPATAALTEVVTLAAAEYPPEFTGTGEAELFGYYPGQSPFVARINKGTGVIEQQWQLPTISDQIRAWAFAHWGGRFYIFTATQDFLGTVLDSYIQRLDPTNGEVVVVVPQIQPVIVGAGVSTCAPVVVE